MSHDIDWACADGAEPPHTKVYHVPTGETLAEFYIKPRFGMTRDACMDAAIALTLQLNWG